MTLNTSRRRAALSANQPPGQRVGRLAIAVSDLTVDDRCEIAVGALLETRSTGGQVLDHRRRADFQIREVDDVQIGLHTRRDDAAILHRLELGRPDLYDQASLKVDDILAGPPENPLSEEVVENAKLLVILLSKMAVPEAVDVREIAAIEKPLSAVL